MILVTGGMGFIGLHTARALLDAGEEVVITHYRARREPDFVKDELGKGVTVRTLDITSPHDVLDVMRKQRITGVVHLAVPGLAALSPAEDFRVNMVGLINILEAARLCDVRRVCLASSLAVYSGLAKGPWQEEATLPMISGTPTEAFKKSFEILGLQFGDRTGLEVVSLRMAGIFGPLYHSMANLPSRLCHAAVRGTPPDFGGARGGQPFEEDLGDMCYVQDCGAGIRAIQMADKLAHRIYNIGSGRATSNKELAAAIQKAVPEVQIALQPGRSPRFRENPYCDLTRTTGEVGYKPKYTIETAVADYIAWLRKNPE